MGNGNNNEHLQRQLYLLLISFGTAALVLALYHIIKVTWYDRNHRSGPIRRPNFLSRRRDHTLETAENSVVGLIPAHKFKKGVGLIGDGLCPVCLSDFEEGEDIRTLPECSHSFHVQCIDMWFYSHSTCPVCRTDAMSSVNLSQHLNDDQLGSPGSVSGPRVQTQSNIALYTV